MRAAVEAVEHRLGTPEIEGVPVLALQRDPDILQRRQMPSLVQNLAGRRLQELGQEIEARRLAGPVGPDQRMNAATADPQIDTANGEETRKLLGQPVGFKNELIGQSDFPHRPSRPTCRRAWPVLSLPAGSWDASKIPSRPGRLRPEYAVNPSD